MTETACQIQWIRNLYEEIGFILGPLPLCIDNQGAIFLASNPAQEGRTKHVRMPEHYICEVVKSGEIQLLLQFIGLSYTFLTFSHLCPYNGNPFMPSL